jgi:hypothetical protein
MRSHGACLRGRRNITFGVLYAQSSPSVAGLYVGLALHGRQPIQGLLGRCSLVSTIPRLSNKFNSASVVCFASVCSAATADPWTKAKPSTLSLWSNASTSQRRAPRWIVTKSAHAAEEGASIPAQKVRGRHRARGVALSGPGARDPAPFRRLAFIGSGCIVNSIRLGVNVRRSLKFTCFFLTRFCFFIHHSSFIFFPFISFRFSFLRLPPLSLGGTEQVLGRPGEQPIRPARQSQHSNKPESGMLRTASGRPASVTGTHQFCC